MDRLAMLFNNVFSKMNFTLILSALIIMNCEEQVNDLWDADDGTDQISPLVGDWYADSMSAYDSYYYEEWYDLMLDKNLEEYNLWLLSDGSFQMILNQNIVLQDECEAFDGIWDNSSGCSGTDDYVDYAPLAYCNYWHEYNQYDIETTECSQDVSIEGTWTTNEESSTLKLSMDSLCINNYSDLSYILDSESCESLSEGEGAGWQTSLARDFTYSIDATNGSISLDGYWFGDSTMVKFYLSIQ